MLYMRINQILDEQNKTMYWLSKQINVSFQNTSKICNCETATIKFSTLESICKTLDCSINDLFDSDDPKMKQLLSGEKSTVNHRDKSAAESSEEDDSGDI